MKLVPPRHAGRAPSHSQWSVVPEAAGTPRVPTQGTTGKSLARLIDAVATETTLVCDELETDAGDDDPT